MMATTIMISTSVKPALRRPLFVFICLLFVHAVELNVRRIIMNDILVPLLPDATAMPDTLAMMKPNALNCPYGLC
jgi:hypothetical protein